MPTSVQILASGDGGFDGTAGRGLFDINAEEGITMPNSLTGIQLLSVAVNAEDPVADQNKIIDVHVAFADSLESVNAGVCFLQSIDGERSHVLFVNPLNGVISVPGKIFVFANVQGVDDFSKVALLAWRRVTHMPNAAGIQG